MKKAVPVLLLLAWLGACVAAGNPALFPRCSGCRAGKCKYHIAADRRLTRAERDAMESAIKTLLDRKRDQIGREHAAPYLGRRIAHQDAIEPLKRVALDRTDQRYVRCEAVTAPSQTADKRVVPLLINLTLDDQVGGHARERLQALTGLGLPPGFQRMKAGERWEEWWPRSRPRYHAAWMKWWQEHKDTFIFDRVRAFVVR